MEIKVVVNLWVFSIAVFVWLLIMGLKLGEVNIPPDINTIFAIITGVILTIIQGFEKGVTFSGTTETTETKLTQTTTLPEAQSPATSEPASPDVAKQETQDPK